MTQYIKTNLSCKDVGYLSQSDDIASTGKLSVDIISGRIFYPDVPIFHTISNEFPGSNVSMLSARCGVTKSAVVQISSRLVQKGLIEACRNDENKKERYYRLTPAGDKARSLLDERNAAAAEKLRGYLCSLSTKKKAAVIEFLEHVEEDMPLYSFPCRRKEGEGSCIYEEESKKEGK